MNRIHFPLLLGASLLLNVLLLFFLLQDKTPASNMSPEVVVEESPTLVQEVAYESGRSYPLMRIVDGDTLTIGFNGTTEYVRLIGIDASEQNDPGGAECYALEATRHLRELAQTGTVMLHFDESQGNRDQYHRLLAYIELTDGTDLGEQMIRDGYVREHTFGVPYARQAQYQAAEAEAITNESGLWAPDTCVE